MLSLIGLLTGFTLLVFGADWFVRGASGLAQKLGVPSVIVGLTVVAFGTSAPELAVSVTASLQGANAIALGNVLGSNLFNLLAVVGASALMAPLVVAPEILRRDWLATIGATVLLLIFAFANGEISRLDAACLLVCFVAILLLQITQATKARKVAQCECEGLHHAIDRTEGALPSDTTATADIPDTTTETLSATQIALYSATGLACIVLGGQISVDAASNIARQFGLSESLIGLTIVAIGTSLPELVTSVIATRKGENDIAIGNVIGSNLFNVLFILGISCALRPIPTTGFVIADTVLLLAVTVGMFLLAKCNQLRKGTGVALLLTYLAYATWVVVR